MTEVPSHDPAPRRRLLWALGVTVLSAAAIASAEVRGHAARVRFEGLPELPRRTALVRDSADAFEIWSAAGLHGRRLVVLTGQWSKPIGVGRHPGGPGGPGPAGAAEEPAVDAGSALFWATRLGLARTLDVVMPPSAFTHRLGEVSGAKELAKEDGAFRLPYNGLERRFSTPRGFAPPGEPVLLLVEPSWFAPGAPPDPLAWLESLGVSWDLALVAMKDPASTEAEEQAAAAFGRAVGAQFLAVAE